MNWDQFTKRDGSTDWKKYDEALAVEAEALKIKLTAQALRTLRMLRASMPTEAETQGECHRTPTGWTLSYGGDYVVDLPRLEALDVFLLVVGATDPVEAEFVGSGADLPAPRMIQGSLSESPWQEAV